MSRQNEPLSFTTGEGLLASLSGVASQTLTVFSPTIASTAFVPDNTAEATSVVGSSAPQSTSSSNADSTSQNSGSGTNHNNNNDSDQSGNRTTVIILATVLSVVGCLMIAGTVWAIMRCRRRRTKLFKRGITPIGDDEIESWKGRRTEKGLDMDAGRPPRSPLAERPEDKGHQKSESTTSIRKPPSVIVYARKSEEFSPMSATLPNYPFSKMSLDGGKRSFDKSLPLTPIQARAPNAREGLTDEAVPGDEPFVGSPRRQGSRLSKMSRNANSTQHMRSKSSRSSSSLRRLGDRSYGYESDDYRPSHEFYPGHSRVSSSQEPPRLSLSDDWPTGAAAAGLSPRPHVRAEDIGRAIG
ncbi:unnamed protein product [Discula destructiva]